MRMVGPVRQSWRGFDGNVEVVTQKNPLERRAPPESPHMASRSMIWRDPPRFPKWHARCTTDRRICIGERACGWGLVQTGPVSSARNVSVSDLRSKHKRRKTSSPLPSDRAIAATWPTIWLLPSTPVDSTAACWSARAPSERPLRRTNTPVCGRRCVMTCIRRVTASRMMA